MRNNYRRYYFTGMSDGASAGLACVVVAIGGAAFEAVWLLFVAAIAAGVTSIFALVGRWRADRDEKDFDYD